MFYVLFNKCNRLGNNLDNLLSRFLIPFFFFLCFFLFVSPFGAVFFYISCFLPMFLLRIWNYITKLSTTCRRLAFSSCAWCRHSSFFLRLTFSSSCELAGCWMQFQMSCTFQTTRKNVMRCTFFAGMLPFFLFVLPLWIHYVRFYRMANSRSLRWASNQTASRVIFIIGICRYWKKCSPKAKVLAVNHQTFDIRMM